MHRQSRSGFTLMELLLVIAILAIVAAIAAPQFYRTSTLAIDDARQTMLKANYSAIKAAVNMRAWDEMNNPAIFQSQIVAARPSRPTAATYMARQSILTASGYVNESAFQIENGGGTKYMLVVTAGSALQLPTATGAVASSALFMQNATIYLIGIARPPAPVAETAITIGGTAYAAGAIDQALRDGKTWSDIWAAVKILP